jgi:hypothetical protein
VSQKEDDSTHPRMYNFVMILGCAETQFFIDALGIAKIRLNYVR